MQAESIYAMDFFTVDTFRNQRFYVLFIIHHSTREIVQFAITQNPVREFVRQQIIELESSLNCIIYLIHDNARQFNLSYLDYGIKEIKTSVLDYFLILNKKQLKNILTEYIDYHNSFIYFISRIRYAVSEYE